MKPAKRSLTGHLWFGVEFIDAPLEKRYY